MFTTRYRSEMPGTFADVTPQPMNAPYWIGWNQALADEMALPVKPNDDALAVFSGQAIFKGHAPIAQKYAGHQFGGWNPDLGDGRGLLLGEWQNGDHATWEMHLKGAGKTPFSRFGDGRAVLRSSIREFLGSEALHALGIPTTRALALVGSSEPVQREQMETGAMVLRVSKSHVRFGHFEWFAFSNQSEQLSALTDYMIRHHYPNALTAAHPRHAFFGLVVQKTAELMAHWMAYGFVHGVMNTDNMSILGETFDYGPYAFLDTTQRHAVFNHTDANGRYAFSKQPEVGFWNLQRLAQALSAIIPMSALNEGLSEYAEHYQAHYHRLMVARLGAKSSLPTVLINEWLTLLESEQKDFHISFRLLADTPVEGWRTLGDDFVDRARFHHWVEQMQPYLFSDDQERQRLAQSVNPVCVARNHHLQSVIEACENGNLKPFNDFYEALSNPFKKPVNSQKWHQAPLSHEQIGELSCSS